VIENGEQIAEMQTVEQAKAYKNERLAKLPEKYKTGQEQYPIIISDGIKEATMEVKEMVNREAKQFLFL